jgi:hypothetical protein
MISLYMGFPTPCFIEGNGDVVMAVAQLRACFPGLKIKHVNYDAQCSLSVLDFCSMVGQKPGPVLLLRPIQSKVLEAIRQRLAANVPVVAETIASEEELHDAVATVVGHFENGEPLVAIDIVVGLLIMAKLDDGHMWAGNAKGYMWASDVPKGRGVDEKYKDRVPHVLNILLQHGVLVKKPSQGKSKFALNPDRKIDIYEMLRDRKFKGAVEGYLQRNHQVESVRVLDDLPDYEDVR